MASVENNIGSTGGVTGKGFVRGQSGNPGGRPRGLARATREVLGGDGERIVRFWLKTMEDPNAKLADRLEASRLLADRGWGRPTVTDPLAEAAAVPSAVLLTIREGQPLEEAQIEEF